jgi:hypothetical protein
MADRRLRYVLVALVASGSADGFLPVTLSFAVLRITGSAGKLGLVLACQSTAEHGSIASHAGWRPGR